MAPRRVAHYNGAQVFVHGGGGGGNNGDALAYELGSYLGGGASGTVYEAVDIATRDSVAFKVLQPLGFKAHVKQLPPGTVPFASDPRGFDWALDPVTDDVIATSAGRELGLTRCMALWGTEFDFAAHLALSDSTRERIARGDGNVVAPKYARFVAERARQLREVDCMRRASGHENVLRLLDVLELVQDSKSNVFLVLELAEGGELFDRIKRNASMPESTVRRYFAQILCGVQFCHAQGIVHRDLKPENILMTRGDVVKICDFGLSTTHASDVASTATLARRHSVVGTPIFTAPEVTGHMACDLTKADAWSLGVLLYAMVSGDLPFAPELHQCARFATFCDWQARFANEQPFLDVDDASFAHWFFPHSRPSPELMRLVVGLMDPDPERRLSVGDALHDGWLNALVADASTPLARATTPPVVRAVPTSAGSAPKPVPLFLQIAAQEDARRLRFASPPLDPRKGAAPPPLELDGDYDVARAATASLQRQRRRVSNARSRSLSPQSHQPPLFSSLVQRSTRFSSTTPAGALLATVARRTQEVMGDDVNIDMGAFGLVVHADGCEQFSVRVFLAARGAMAAASSSSSYVVEFIRGEMSIFDFKALFDALYKAVARREIAN